MTAREGSRTLATAGSARFVHTNAPVGAANETSGPQMMHTAGSLLLASLPPRVDSCCPGSPGHAAGCPTCREERVQQHDDIIRAQNCAHLHSRVPRPEMTLPLTPSALGLGPLRLNHTFSKPMLRRVLLKKRRNMVRSWSWRKQKRQNQEHRVILRGPDHAVCPRTARWCSWGTRMSSPALV